MFFSWDFFGWFFLLWFFFFTFPLKENTYELAKNLWQGAIKSSGEKRGL